MNNEFYSESGNQIINFSISGDAQKQNLLLIHGLMGSSTSFTDLMPYLEKEFRVTSIDLPGHGDSNLETEFSIDKISNIVIEFIEENFSGPILITGYSLGGTIANDINQKSPNLISKCALIDPWFSNNASTDLLLFKALSLFEKNAKKSWKTDLDAFKHTSKINSKLTQNQISLIATNRFKYNINIWDYTSIQKETLIINKGNNTEIPTLIIKPSSSLIKLSQIENIKDIYNSLKVVIIENTTHMIIFENPEQISLELIDFYKG
jgi:pimeloyl-ACP methyl ester carboxylesterase